MRQPVFWSLALAEITDPDYTHVAVDVLPAHATADPAAWARNLFSPRSLPRPVSWLLWARRMLDARLGRPQWCDAFQVGQVSGDEALVAMDARLLDLRVGVGVDEDAALVRVVTAVRFKGAHVQRWSWPVRAMLPFVVRGMIGRSRRSLSGVTRT
ncbi:Protein of unknown function [Microbacterium sp. cf046]|uniref:DUF2867 domain-containing protein n=1 Tax=Microbacterium sp. cf046 TaxID=1761803 RepID=UPI0008E453B3|nr:DUF2867 domain-containing protein [Microbacterium sp. cf046]SFS17207.1 Protein of unknown function [Microbacterium sp. cf046]